MLAGLAGWRVPVAMSRDQDPQPRSRGLGPVGLATDISKLEQFSVASCVSQSEDCSVTTWRPIHYSYIRRR